MRMLFGVFDWGLGHATRDTPIIEALLKENEVDILSTGRSLKLLKDHFKKRCRYFNVPSVYAPYSHSKFFVAKFIISIPRMYFTFKKARKISEKIIKKNNYNIVISDCRYDVYDKKENSFLINHQLKLKSPIFQWGVDKYMAFRMGNYNLVIVPDFKNRMLSDELSINKSFKGKINFIGPLSRLKKRNVKEDIDFFISLSGSEPSRTVFEKIILSQVSDLNGKIVITRGMPEWKNKWSKQRITFYNFLDLEKQEEIMNRAKFIISRSGYSTLMDLIELKKNKVLFVPTPGQTEQEHLADFYEKRNMFHHIHQNKLNLIKDINDSLKFKGYKTNWTTEDSVRKFMQAVFHEKSFHRSYKSHK